MPAQKSHSLPKRRVTMVYFSPTGTTERILEQIASGMGHNNPTKVNLTGPKGRKEAKRLFDNRQRTTDYWLIGSPVHSGRIPLFMENGLVHSDGQGKPTVAVVVYGNRDYGIALRQLVESLTSRNFWVVGAAAFVAEHSFSRMFPIALGRPDQKDLETARLFGESVMAKDSRQTHIFADRIEGELEFMLKLFPAHGPRPTVIAEQCKGCRICVNACPLGLIDPDTKVHRDNKAKQLCLGCMSCVKRCPNNARVFHVPALMKSFMSNHVFKKALHSRREPLLLFGET